MIQYDGFGESLGSILNKLNLTHSTHPRPSSNLSMVSGSPIEPSSIDTLASFLLRSHSLRYQAGSVDIHHSLTYWWKSDNSLKEAMNRNARCRSDASTLHNNKLRKILNSFNVVDWRIIIRTQRIHMVRHMKKCLKIFELSAPPCGVRRMCGRTRECCAARRPH
jgi:hypothetical protein